MRIRLGSHGAIAGLLALTAASAPAVAAAHATSWPGTSIRSAAASLGNNALVGVSCPSPSFCMAVGDYSDTSNVPQTLAESWNGTTWSIVPTPDQGSSGTNVLTAVSCPATNSCVAVGTYFDSSNGVDQTLVESWNGATWSIVPSPNRRLVPSSNFLYGVSCLSANACMAVGYYYPSSTVYRTLIESWNGTRWAIAPSRDRGRSTRQNSLASISCPAISSCTAVGYYANPKAGADKTLTESWNGTKWSLTPSPNRGRPTSNNYLNNTSCLSTSSCLAVGYHGRSPGAGDRTLIESWNGTTWSVTPSSNRGPNSNTLWSASCAPPTTCMAVGNFATSNLGDKTLIESWNGTRWTIAPSPNQGPSSYQNTLISVSCPSTSFCAAVGYTYTSNDATENRLIESWNGTTWSLVPNSMPRLR